MAHKDGKTRHVAFLLRKDSPAETKMSKAIDRAIKDSGGVDNLSDVVRRWAKIGWEAEKKHAPDHKDQAYPGWPLIPWNEAERPE